TIVFKKYFFTLGICQLRRKNMADSLVETIITSEKESVLSEIFNGKVNHVRCVVTAGNIHIYIRRVLKRFAGVLPVNSAADMRKLKHRFRVSFRYIHKILGQGYVPGFVRIELYTRITDCRMHQDDHLQINELLDDGIERGIIYFYMVIEFSGAHHAGIYTTLYFFQRFLPVGGVHDKHSDEPVRMLLNTAQH